MKIFFAGDVMGRSGREALEKYLPVVREELEPDVVIANGENAASGFGITRKIAQQFYEWGVDCITTGNHVWDQREMIGQIQSDPKLLRPLNFPPGTPGQGLLRHQLPDGRSIVIINAMGRLFMEPLDDPFAVVKAALADHRLGQNVNAVFVDFHAETTSEKMAFAQYLDGKVSAVVGTHTHIPTADAQIFDGGTAYQTDAGMCGDYNSVIGMDKVIPINKFVKKVPGERMQPAKGEGTLCGVFVRTDDRTGKAFSIKPVRLGPRLHETPLS